MYKILHLIILSLLLSQSCQASNDNDSTTVLKIKDDNFISILDSVINFEKQCDYYTSDLLFSVGINRDSIIQIGSIDQIIKSDDIHGCFIYKEHLFIVTGMSLRQSLFAVTDKKKKIKYYEPHEIYDPKSGVVTIDIFEDDRFTFWLYKYIDGKFFFQGRHSYCK